MGSKAVKFLCLSIFVLVLATPALAQNTKGDKPTPTPREARFKTPKKQKKTRTPSQRVRRSEEKPGRSALPPRRQSGPGERPGRPIAPQFSKSRAGGTERAWKGDVGGRRVNTRPSTGRARNVYPQPSTTNFSSRSRTTRDNQNPNVRRVRKMQREDDNKPRVGRPIRPTFHKTKPQHGERAWRGDITGRPLRAGSSDHLRPPAGQGPGRIFGSSVRPRGRGKGGIAPSVSGRARKTFSQRSFYVNNQSLRRQSVYSNRPRYSTQNKPAQRSVKVIPRSASASYLSRRSTNVWAHFPRPKRKGERAITTDLAGKKLRAKNFETQRPVLSNPTWNYQRRVAQGERPYKGPAAGGYVSRTRSGRAWRGDIAHRAIRGGFRSKKGEQKAGSPIFGRGRGPGDIRVDKYQGNIRGGRRVFNEQGEEYTGNIRSQRPLRGGGSVSGAWNNKGQPIQGRTPGKGSSGIGYSGNIKGKSKVFGDQGEGYTGNIKTTRPDKGGGSRSGRHWNNNNMPILVRTPGGKSARVAGYQGNIRGGRKIFEDQGEGYSGNIKAGRPEKGGGSMSGKLWNNRERPIDGRAYAGQTRISRYSGNMRASRPEKGGGSVSGQLWNNRERPIDGRAYVGQTKISRYAGNIKARRPDKGGGSVSGKLWNNDEKPIDGRGYTGLKQISRYSGTTKATRPEKGGGSVSGQLWNNNEQPVEGRSYTGLKALSRYQGTVKVSRGDYQRNPNSHNDALPVLKASAANLKAGRTVSGVKRDWDYIRNPSSADDAQRTREPGRAFGRLQDFQGNIRVKRFDLFKNSDLHPDAQFVKTNKNNVAEEKDMLTNFKLWWARLFRKAETQPDHLKENDKDHKPRYDKGEAGLWYD